MIWLATGAFILEWVSTLLSMSVLNAASQTLNVIFFMVIVAMLIAQVAKAKKVNARVIFEAVNGYLLLGLVFVLLIALMTQYDPSSYNFTIDGHWKTSDLIYFGFVTLSTLGYGDLLPLTQASKSLALLTTLGGQLYLAVLVALLVGKFSSQKG